MRFFFHALLAGIAFTLAGCGRTEVTIDSQKVEIKKTDDLGRLESVKQVPLSAPLQTRTTAFTYDQGSNNLNRAGSNQAAYNYYSYDAQGNRITNPPPAATNQ